MQTLTSKQSLPLLLLLLQPLPLQAIERHEYSGEQDDWQEAFLDYLEELYGTGPTKPPTKETFQKHVLIDPESPLNDPYLCNYEMMMKNIHDRFLCRKEHFFLQVAYKELKMTCGNVFVECKNGVRGCHKSKKIIEGVYCNLTHGIRMPGCNYESFYKQGNVLITCKWQNNIHEIIPDRVNGFLEISGKQKSARP